MLGAESNWEIVSFLVFVRARVRFDYKVGLDRKIDARFSVWERRACVFPLCVGKACSLFSCRIEMVSR